MLYLPPSNHQTYQYSSESSQINSYAKVNLSKGERIDERTLMYITNSISVLGIRRVLTLCMKKLESQEAARDTTDSIYRMNLSTAASLDWLINATTEELLQIVVMLKKELANIPEGQETENQSVNTEESNFQDNYTAYHTAATTFQQYIRSFNITEIKEPFGVVPALRFPPPGKGCPNGVIRAFKLKPETNQDGQPQFPWTKPPPLITNSTRAGDTKLQSNKGSTHGGSVATETKIDLEKKLSYGAYKLLLYRDSENVGLYVTTEKEEGIKITEEEDPIWLKKLSRTADPAILQFLEENRLTKIVPQTRVAKNLLISKNLGPDLHSHKKELGYVFNSEHWKDLASNLDVCHLKGIVHRDIKLDNLFFHKGEIKLSDLCSMREVDKIEEGFFGTKRYLPAGLLEKGGNNADRNQPWNAFKKDQFTFLVSMMYSQIPEPPISENPEKRPVSKTYQSDLVQIDSFVKRMPCHWLLQLELLFFLNDPQKNTLSLPLKAYFDPSSEATPGLLEEIVLRNNKHLVSAANIQALREEKNHSIPTMTAHVHCEYTFTPSHFKRMATEIDLLHFLDIVHRDIQLGTMVFYKNNVFLTHANSLGKVGFLNQTNDNNPLLHPVFKKIGDENADRKSPINAYKKDQYTFLMSMMQSRIVDSPQEGQYGIFQISAFVYEMPCELALKWELFWFLRSPAHHALSMPLANYLSA